MSEKAPTVKIVKAPLPLEVADGGKTGEESSRERNGVKVPLTLPQTETGTSGRYARGARFPPQKPTPQPAGPVLPMTTRAKLAEELGDDAENVLVHEAWNYPHVGGRTRFWCGGRCYQGPPEIDDIFTTCAWTSILCPAVFFFVVCTPTLWSWGPWLPIAVAVLLALTIIGFFMTAFTDPGIIPRPAMQLLVPGLQEEVAKASGLLDRRGGHMSEVMAVNPDPFLMHELEPLGYWWCRWCHMIQPPRAKHCRDCDCCVLVQDHHCPFLNNCIGRRNYLIFNIFVALLTTYAIVSVVGIFIWMRQTGQWQCLASIRDCSSVPLNTLVAIVGAFLVIVPGILIIALSAFLCFHMSLIVRNRTTREVLTGRLVTDATSVLCAERGPSMLHGRDPILLSTS